MVRKLIVVALTFFVVWCCLVLPGRGYAAPANDVSYVKRMKWCNDYVTRLQAKQTFPPGMSEDDRNRHFRNTRDRCVLNPKDFEKDNPIPKR